MYTVSSRPGESYTMRPRKEENEERTLLMQEESRHQPRGKELLLLGAQILSPDPVYAGIYLQGKGCVFAS